MPGTHFSVPTVVFVVRAVLEMAASLRGAAGTHYLARQVFCGQEAGELTHVTVRNFILRLGLYELMRPKAFRDDRVWITDHTIQAGTTKCLVVLAISHDDYLALNRPLEHRDLEMLALIPVETSTGAVVHQQFTKLCEQYGVPRAILSDRGSDLKRASNCCKTIIRK